MPKFNAQKHVEAAWEKMQKAKAAIRNKMVRGTANGYQCLLCGMSWDVSDAEEHSEGCLAIIVED